jgi:hypothetical protein
VFYFSVSVHTLRLLRTPHPGQLQGFQSPHRFNIHCWGRQSGKTTYGLNKVQGRAWQGRKDGVYWYVLQTYDAAHVAFKRLYRFYRNSPRAFDKKPNESDLSCRLRHGPEISFKSGRNFEDLRVETLDGVVIDEYRQQSPLLWPVVIRPMLAARQGWADLLSTPNGFDHFHDLFEEAKTNPEWGWFHHPSWIAPWWTPAEIASAKSTMSQAVFEQEIGAQFRDMVSGRVYSSYDASIHEMDQNPFVALGRWSPHLPLVVGMDFNLNPMVWELGQNRGREWYWGDEINLENSYTQEAAKVLIEKVRGHKPGVVIIGDASGKAKQRAAAAQSDYDIVCAMMDEAGITWVNQTPAANPAVKDRVNAVNSILRSADGSVHMWHHSDCKALRKDMQRVLWPHIENKRKAPDLTHASDAMGYPVHHLTPIPSIKQVGGLFVVRR